MDLVAFAEEVVLFFGGFELAEEIEGGDAIFLVRRFEAGFIFGGQQRGEGEESGHELEGLHSSVEMHTRCQRRLPLFSITFGRLRCF